MVFGSKMELLEKNWFSEGIFCVKNVFGLKMGLLWNIDLQSIQNTDLESLKDNSPWKPHFYWNGANFTQKFFQDINFP